MKKCTKCNIEKNITEFGIHIRQGVLPHCKKCHNLNMKIYRQTKKGKLNIKILRAKYKKYGKTKISLTKYYKSDHGSKMLTAYSAKRRAAKLQRTMSWSNLKAIKKFYLNCPKGYHVDHIIPLQGTNVSGLHVLNNLQYLTKLENSTKGNNWLGLNQQQ